MAWGPNPTCCLILLAKFYWRTVDVHRLTHRLWRLAHCEGRAGSGDSDHMFVAHRPKIFMIQSFKEKFAKPYSRAFRYFPGLGS